MPSSHVERETGEHRDDRRPTEKDTDLNGDRTEAELERRVAVDRGFSAEGGVQASQDAETRVPGHSCKRPAGSRIVGQEAGQTDPT
jgi:hypothetical protein